MLTAQAAIHRYRRDIAIGRALRSVLFAAALASVLVSPLVGLDRTVGLSVVLALWFALGVTGAKGSRILASSPRLIASGQFEEAERQIEEALRSFSISRTAKLLGLHHLAVLRHKQRRWGDAVALCRAVLNQRSAAVVRDIDGPSRLMLADALLELGDVRGAGDALAGLHGQRLSLGESLSLMQSQLDFESRVGAWDRMAAGLPTKVQLAELMPPAASARVQALLAVAARRTGRPDWADWLRRRVELLADVGKLTADRAVLWELWKKDDGAVAEGAAGVGGGP